MHKGSFVAQTVVSRSHTEISDEIMGNMAQQLGVTAKAFREMLDCIIDRDSYLAIALDDYASQPDDIRVEVDPYDRGLLTRIIDTEVVEKLRALGYTVGNLDLAERRFEMEQDGTPLLVLLTVVVGESAIDDVHDISRIVQEWIDRGDAPPISPVADLRSEKDELLRQLRRQG